MQQLLSKGANINSLSDRFGTALSAAIERDHLDVVQLFLRAGIDVNYVSPKHGTALHYACKEQNVRMVRLLWNHGADPNGICVSQGPPLTSSISSPVSLANKRDRSRDIAEIILRLGNYKQITEQDFLIAVRRIDRRNPDGKVGGKLSHGEDVVKLFLSHDRDF